MHDRYDVVVIGAGPAGMSAAITLRQSGISVLVVDEQSMPGGQIWREVERVATTATGQLLGEAYQEGTHLTRQFRKSGAIYQPNTQVWKIEPGWQVFLKHQGEVSQVEARRVIVAIGAQERPAPFPGWTLPGVLTVGAAQVLLKNAREIPSEPVWIVGSGPLTLLYMVQLLKAGGKIAGWVDTTQHGLLRRMLPHSRAALKNVKTLSKGLMWQLKLRYSGVWPIRNVTSWKAEGNDQVESIVYTTKAGKTYQHDAHVILSHEGVIPQVYITQSLGCEHAWHPGQHCWIPKLDRYGETSVNGIYVAGDGANIGGVELARLRGEQVALRIAQQLERITQSEAKENAQQIGSKSRHLSCLRPMLDAMYPPAKQVLSPADETIVCRCESLTAGKIRSEARKGVAGCNQLKAFTRAGMGPCQGRLCGAVVSQLIAEVQHKRVETIETLHVRPPLKPITFGELATLNLSQRLKSRVATDTSEHVLTEES